MKRKRKPACSLTQAEHAGRSIHPRQVTPRLNLHGWGNTVIGRLLSVHPAGIFAPLDSQRRFFFSYRRGQVERRNNRRSRTCPLVTSPAHVAMIAEESGRHVSRHRQIHTERPVPRVKGSSDTCTTQKYVVPRWPPASLTHV